jgi:hypothetical protein
MRLFWAGILTTGLFLIGLNAYERRHASEESVMQEGIVVASEDGTPIPAPDPTPPPKKAK